ncbi:MAG: hypothetical protein Nk1A_7520 [Endomicrobiia bacterium]|nr:MAG: hypothetical protein Nk1A_7520 [Endomicrobiia bacterium]
MTKKLLALGLALGLGAGNVMALYDNSTTQPTCPAPVREVNASEMVDILKGQCATATEMEFLLANERIVCLLKAGKIDYKEAIRLGKAAIKKFDSTSKECNQIVLFKNATKK